MVEKNHEYGVIMEDNIYFTGPIEKTVEKYIEQLNTMYCDWDILFDSNWIRVNDNGENNMVEENILVYPKSNNPTNNYGGGSRLAQFYIVTNKCAKTLFENYIPFKNNPDHWMNELFRKLDIQCFWSEPSITHTFPHISTTQN